MLDLIVSVREHCLSFYFTYQNYSGACKMFFDRFFFMDWYEIVLSSFAVSCLKCFLALYRINYVLLISTV